MSGTGNANKEALDFDHGAGRGPVPDIGVAVYAHLHRTRSPTGVGQHLTQMIKGLARVPSVEMMVIAPRNQLDETGRIPSQNPLAGIPARGLPLDRRWLEAMWERLDRPRIDHWCRGVDWVYSPTEAYIAVGRPRLAVTVHDLHAFEIDLPWSGTPSHRAFRRRWEAMFEPIVKRADCILAVSDFTRRRLVELLGAKDERIVVVGNGVDSAFFDPPVEVEPCEYHGVQYVVVIGGLTRRKGGDLVLSAARELQRQAPELHVLVAGTGEQEFDAPASELPNVTCLGFVGVAELTQLLRGAVAMMFLSRYEGFGIPAVEAMAAGTPVVASRCGALPEVVGEAGLLVDAENASEVASTIRMLSSDSVARSDLSARGRKRAEDYRWELCVDRLIAALRQR
jgi:glycosyltransferase involved in cell wall biosynthesis